MFGDLGATKPSSVILGEVMSKLPILSVIFFWMPVAFSAVDFSIDCEVNLPSANQVIRQFTLGKKVEGNAVFYTSSYLGCLDGCATPLHDFCFRKCVD